ncbi:MAG: hypothetical protein AABY15_05550 [Nanoarchaeota archaeon]
MEGKKDYLDGDHSFKNWFKIMWKNGYIFIFLVALAGIITQFVKWDDMMEMVYDNFYYSNFGGIMCIIAMLIPWAIIGIVSYKGFYQFWNDLKNGRSR